MFRPPYAILCSLSLERSEISAEKVLYKSNKPYRVVNIQWYGYHDFYRSRLYNLQYFLVAGLQVLNIHENEFSNVCKMSASLVSSFKTRGAAKCFRT